MLTRNQGMHIWKLKSKNKNSSKLRTFLLKNCARFKIRNYSVTFIQQHKTAFKRRHFWKHGVTSKSNLAPKRPIKFRVHRFPLEPTEPRRNLTQSPISDTSADSMRARVSSPTGNQKGTTMAAWSIASDRDWPWQMHAPYKTRRKLWPAPFRVATRGGASGRREGVREGRASFKMAAIWVFARQLPSQEGFYKLSFLFRNNIRDDTMRWWQWHNAAVVEVSGDTDLMLHTFKYFSTG